MTVDTATRFIGSTLHDDVSFMTDPEGAIVSTKTYDPWGVVRSDEGEEVDLGFQGDPTDSETGLVDMGARYYLPSLGRFTTQDTYIGQTTDPLSENRFIYGEDDPVSMFDPTGYANAKIGPVGPCERCDVEEDPGGSSGKVAEFYTEIEMAGGATDIPPAVIAAVLVTSWEIDQDINDFIEEQIAGRLGCKVSIEWLCQKPTMDAGQINVGRAMGADHVVLEIVRETPHYRRKMWWNQPEAKSLMNELGVRQRDTFDDYWESDDGAVFDRLGHTDLNILYVAAYLDQLRDAHPAGTSWGTIYSETADPTLGEYNADPMFRKQFEFSMMYYSGWWE